MTAVADLLGLLDLDAGVSLLDLDRQISRGNLKEGRSEGVAHRLIARETLLKVDRDHKLGLSGSGTKIVRERIEGAPSPPAQE